MCLRIEAFEALCNLLDEWTAIIVGKIRDYLILCLQEAGILLKFYNCAISFDRVLLFDRRQ